MPPAPQGISELASFLRRLRTERWPGVRLTQAALGRALSLSAATIASWENQTQPKLPPPDRLAAYAQFFATRRSVQGSHCSLIPVDRFSPDEQAEYEKLHGELLELHAAASGNGTAPAVEVIPRPWFFSDSGPLTIICGRLPAAELTEMARPANPNYTKLLSFADLDALVNLFGHVRAENPEMRVHFKTAEDVEADDLSGHVVMLGGVGLNDITRRLFADFEELTSLPVAQREDNDIDPYGEYFVTTIDGQERQHVARWADANFSELLEDVGLLIRMPNPLNSSRTLTMCNGIHSRGVLGAVRSLTDPSHREANERYIAQNLPGDDFGILMRVRVIGGKCMTPDFTTRGTILHQWPAADG